MLCNKSVACFADRPQTADIFSWSEISSLLSPHSSEHSLLPAAFCKHSRQNTNTPDLLENRIKTKQHLCLSAGDLNELDSLQLPSLMEGNESCCRHNHEKNITFKHNVNSEHALASLRKVYSTKQKVLVGRRSGWMGWSVKGTFTQESRIWIPSKTIASVDCFKKLLLPVSLILVSTLDKRWPLPSDYRAASIHRLTD